jgi:hypothetical protein
VLHSWFTNIPYISTDTVARTSNPDSATLQKVYLVATVISAFSAAIGLSEGCTVMIKLLVKRRRPNFYALCGFDSVTKKCMADLVHIREVRLYHLLFLQYFFLVPSIYIMLYSICMIPYIVLIKTRLIFPSRRDIRVWFVVV